MAGYEYAYVAGAVGGTGIPDVSYKSGGSCPSVAGDFGLAGNASVW